MKIKTVKKALFENIQNDVKRLITDKQKTEDISATIIAFLEEYRNLTGKEKERLSEFFWLLVKPLRDLSIEEITNNLVELNDAYIKKIDKAGGKDKIDIINNLIAKTSKKSIENIKNILSAELSKVEQNDFFEYERLNLTRLREISEKDIDEGKDAYIKLLKELERQGGLTPIIKEPNCIGYRINDMKASVASSGYTEWCTARTSNNMFNNYKGNGLSIFYFPNIEHTYSVTNDGERETVTFGRRFGVTIDDLDDQCQTEWNDTEVDDFLDILVKNIGEEKANKITKNYLQNRYLIQVVEEGNTEIVQVLLEAGADPNAKKENGETALILASKEGYPEIVKLLLKAGADPNAEGKYGYTALIIASSYGYTEIVQLLLKEGADINAKEDNGKTSLILASEESYTGTVELLLEAGADVNAKNNWGVTALMCSAERGKTEIVQLLLEKGVDVNIKDKEGWTALMCASLRGKTEIVQLLLEKGVDVNIKDKIGVTALILASEKGYTEVVKLLLEAGANVNAKNNYSETSLILASERGYTEIVKFLLEADADVNAKNKNGWTALMWALKYGYTGIVNLLKQYGAVVSD